MINSEIRNSLSEHEAQKDLRTEQNINLGLENTNKTQWQKYKNTVVKVQDRLRIVALSLQMIPSGYQIVWFRFNGVLKIVKIGLNRILDYNERLAEAQALAEVLSKGWIPEHSAKVSNKSISLIEAINYGFEQKKLSVQKNTIDNFRTSVNFFCYAVKKLKFSQLKVGNFERSHAKAILEFLKKDKEWTNQNYNKHLG